MEPPVSSSGKREIDSHDGLLLRLVRGAAG